MKLSQVIHIGIVLLINHMSLIAQVDSTTLTKREQLEKEFLSSKYDTLHRFIAGKNDNDTLLFWNTVNQQQVGYGLEASYEIGVNRDGKDTLYKATSRFMEGERHGIIDWTFMDAYREMIIGIIRLKFERGKLIDVLKKDVLFVDQKQKFVSKQTFFETLNTSPSNWTFSLIPSQYSHEAIVDYKIVFYLDDTYAFKITKGAFVHQKYINRFYRKLRKAT